MTRRPSAPAVFAIVFIAGYFIWVFTYMSPRILAGEPMRTVRWIPFVSIVLAMTVAALLARNAKTPAVTPKTATPSRRFSWAVRTMVVVYGLTLLAGIGHVLSGAMPLKLAVPGLLVSALLITFFCWLATRQRQRG